MSHAAAHDAVERSSTGLPHGKVAMWWFLVSEIAIFGGLIATYVLMHVAHPEWSEHAAHTLSAAGATNTVVLLTSSLFAVLAHDSANQGKLVQASNYLFGTVGGGVMFLCIKSFEYYHEIEEGFTPVTNVFWSFYFGLTGLHALHVIIGMSALTYVAVNVRKGKLVRGVEYAGIYWHLVDVIWIFLFPLVYLAS